MDEERCLPPRPCGAVAATRNPGRPAAPNRVKPWAAAVLVAGLAAAWLAVTGSQHSSPSGSAAVAGAPRRTTVAASPPPVVRVDTVSLRAALHAPPTCTDVPGAAPALACVYAHVRVDARLLSPNAARQAYPAARSQVAATRRAGVPGGPGRRAGVVATERAEPSRRSLFLSLRDRARRDLVVRRSRRHRARGRRRRRPRLAVHVVARTPRRMTASPACPTLRSIIRTPASRTTSSSCFAGRTRRRHCISCSGCSS